MTRHLYNLDLLAKLMVVHRQILFDLAIAVIAEAILTFSPSPYRRQKKVHGAINRERSYRNDKEKNNDPNWDGKIKTEKDQIRNGAQKEKQAEKILRVF